MNTRTTSTFLRIIAATAGAALLLGGCSDDTSADGATTTAPEQTTTTLASTLATSLPTVGPASYAGFLAQPTACGAEAPAPAEELAFVEPEDQGLSGIIRATIVTSCGRITVDLDADAAPLTVDSFVFLARQGFFDGTVSHRVLPGFVVQAGDPTGTGRGGPGYTVPDEFPEPPFEYATGVLAMANAGPGTTGSQFFIMLGDSGLPPQYSAFGNVVDDGETAATLAAISSIPLGFNAATGELSVPLETLYIEEVIIGS